MLRQVSINAQGLRAWNELKSENDQNFLQFESLSRSGFIIVGHSIAEQMEELKQVLPDDVTSYTTSCKIDLEKALIKSIQVTNNGGRWIVRGIKLPHSRVQPNLDEVLPQEPFDTNQIDFEYQFDDDERYILSTPNNAQKKAFERQHA